MQDTHTI